jgi:hypothetical protein
MSCYLIMRWELTIICLHFDYCKVAHSRCAVDHKVHISQYKVMQLFPVAVWSKVYVCGCSLAGMVVSNSAGGM